MAGRIRTIKPPKNRTTATVYGRAFARARPSLYFVQEGDDGPIKIGCGWEPFNRLNGLQVGNPRELRMIAIVPGDVREERRLHSRFAHLRLRGKWFAPAEELLAFIETLVEVRR